MNEYLKQNMIGFEGDCYLRIITETLCNDQNFDVIIETGSFKGMTTKHFCKMAKQVITVEINKENFNDTCSNLKDIDNVKCVFGNSVDALKQLLPDLKEQKLFLWLDAHWGNDNPLLDELKTIQDNNLKPHIAIHDFKVPGNPTLGFDVYGNIVYEWDWISQSIENIYGKDNFIVSYNNEKESTGARRGTIFIQPK